MSAPQIQYPPTSGGGTPTGGSGTANTIPLWTGSTPSTTLTDSLLSQSGAIVTNSGTFRAADGTFSEPGYTFSGSSGSGMYRRSSGSILAFSSSGTFAFGVSSSQRMYIGTSATAVPTERLEVGGGIRVAGTANVATATASQPGVLSLEYPVTRLYTGDGTGFTFAISKRSGSVTTDMLSVVDNTGNVGIGTAAPGARLHVLAASAYAIFASTNNTGYVEFRHTTSTLAGYVGTGLSILSGAANNDVIVRSEGAGGAVKLATNGNNLRASVTDTSLDISSTSGYGLKLPATPGNADTQTLDCYLDGGASGGATWAPVDNSGAGLTFTVTSARYIRIGRLVVASFDITFPATASGAQAKVSLPVTAQAVWQGASIGFGPNVPGLSAAVNNADLNFWTYGAATTNAALSGARLIVTMSYFAN